MRRRRDAVHQHFTRPPRRRGLARRVAPLRRRAWRSSSATSRSSTPTRSMRGAAPACWTSSTSCASSSASASRSTWSTTATASTEPAAREPHRASTSPAKYTVERPLHLGAALAGRLARARQAPSRDRAAARARRSSSATTCSARSATPTSPASRSATTSAKASRRRSLRSRSARAEPADQVLLGRLGAADLDADEVAALQDVFVRYRRARQRSSARSTGCVGEAHRRARRRTAHARRRALLDELAAYVAWRDRLTLRRWIMRSEFVESPRPCPASRPGEPAGHLRRRAREAVRRGAGRRRTLVHGRPRRGVRAARTERRGQDHHRRDPRGLPARPTPARCACSASTRSATVRSCAHASA